MGFIITDIISGISDIMKLIPKSEQKIITELINSISIHSVLYTKQELEFTSKVSKSIEAVNNKVNSSMQQLQQGSVLQEDMMLLQKVCSDFLGKVYNISIQLEIYVTGIRQKQRAAELGTGVYSVTEQDKSVIKHYEYIGEVSLAENPKINITNIFPDGSKMAYVGAFYDFQKDFGSRLMILAAKSQAVLPEVLRPIIPLPEFIRSVTA